MKISEPNDDDFFAPRPKLSRAVLKIRVIAFCFALGTSLACNFFSLMEWLIPENLVVNWALIAFLFAFQTLVFVPCWRAWFLRRWAWIPVCFLLLGMGCVTIFFGPLFLLLGIPMILAAVEFGLAMEAENDRLKSGF